MRERLLVSASSSHFESMDRFEFRCDTTSRLTDPKQKLRCHVDCVRSSRDPVFLVSSECKIENISKQVPSGKKIFTMNRRGD